MDKTSTRTLVDALENGAEINNRGLYFLDRRLQQEFLPWSAVLRESQRRCRYLMSLGLKKKERLGLIVSDEKNFVLWFFGSVMAGCIPVPTYPPIPTRKTNNYIANTAGVLSSCSISGLITSQQLLPVINNLKPHIPSLSSQVIIDETCMDDNETYAGSDHRVKINPDDVCFIQCTSGSSGMPKGVIVTHDNLLANVRGTIHRLKIVGDIDIAVTWLPLYHDMGLVGFVALPAVAIESVVFMSAFSFVTRPQSWLEIVDKYRGSISASPCFGLGLASKHGKQIERLDLSCLRVIVCGGEPINPITIRRFINVYRGAQLNSDAIVPAYGMSEATSCITMSECEKPYKTVKIDRETYEREDRALLQLSTNQKNSIEIVSCGQPVSPHRIKIVNAADKILSDGEVGEILFKGPSVTLGYIENTVASKALLHEGWIRTGDIGFIFEGDLYICGRKKELIIIVGRNFHPHSIETIVESVPGIRTGNVVAFSFTGSDTERLVIVAECNVGAIPFDIKKAINSALIKCFGIRPYEIVLTVPRSLPKTSSGKLQRLVTKRAYLSDGLKPLQVDASPKTSEQTIGAL